MIMRHYPSGDPPEPLDTVSIRIIGRCACQLQVLFQFGQHTAHEQRPSQGERLQIVGKHNSDVPATSGAGNGSTHLFAEHIRRPSRSHPAIEPAIAPVDQAKAIDLAVKDRAYD